MSDTNPQIMLRWSDDGAHTWSNELWRTMGKLGAYKSRVKFYRLGRAKKKRVYEFRITDPIKVAIIAGNIDAEVSQ